MERRPPCNVRHIHVLTTPGRGERSFTMGKLPVLHAACSNDVPLESHVSHRAPKINTQRSAAKLEEPCGLSGWVDT
eukprot:2768847-Amphidinium_carterae.1